MTRITPRQLDVLLFVRQYRHKHGYAPTMREIATGLDWSVATAFEYVVLLTKKGVIRRDPLLSRSIEIIDESVLPALPRLVLPVLGWIS